MRPAGMPGDPKLWQQRKSSLMREAILDAAIDCLAEDGHAALTTAAVARRAAVSRGTLHHHFATRTELVTALVEYVLYRRLHHYLDEYLSGLSEHTGSSLIERASELHWQSLETREFTAYLELALAARTDPELESVLVPAARRFDEVWLAEMKHAFPQWSRDWERLQRANDITTAAHIGLRLNAEVIGPERVDAVRSMVVEALFRAHGEGF